ncbi:hypothetical protein [Pseudomonas typographi]|uniref:Tail assembly chaperone n=1 Tax=Pseudomonas typographi TaxID=2715964 RepID=A0ABR7ZA21_9PSED|nr:hypothetical protein [Pseudomonas typographi]MBD1602267.1 hypothetical protein [Pseudomonas typographi]
MNEWKLVPVEPTDEMIEAAGEAYEFDAEAEDELGFNIAVTNTAAVYRAMIAAAPQPPAGREPEVRGYVVAGSMFFDVEVIDRAAYTTLAAERDALQSELTKVREWAVERWKDEVSQRPLQNIHRRSFDDTWRQVITRLGGDHRELCGPTHDELLAHQSAPAAKGESYEL